MEREVTETDKAPSAIGSYSQAVRAGGLLFMSGQIPLDPATGKPVGGDFETQVERVIANLQAVAEAAGASLADAVKITVYLTDLSNFALVNEAMARHFPQPFPARAAVGVAALPLGVPVEMDAIVALPSGTYSF